MLATHSFEIFQLLQTCRSLMVSTGLRNAVTNTKIPGEVEYGQRVKLASFIDLLLNTLAFSNLLI